MVLCGSGFNPVACIGALLFLSLNVGSSFGGVDGGIDIQFELSVLEGSVEEFAEEGNAPTASSACSTAFADLAGDFWLVNANIVHNFAL